MDSTLSDISNLRVLVVEPQQDQASDLLRALQQVGIQADHQTVHLRAMPALEDNHYDCLLVAALGADISGPELCALIRSRESRHSAPPVYLILYGPESQLELIASAGRNADDYILTPCLDTEVVWRIDHAAKHLELRRKSLAVRVVDPDSGLMNPEGLKIFLYEEVNRVGRRHGWFSLSLLRLGGLDGLRISYGEGWLQWFSSGIWAYLRRQLRNYDRLAVLDSGMLGLISPDLDEVGTRALLTRLASAVEEYRLAELHEDMAPMRLSARYLCLSVLGDYKQFERTGDVLWKWLEERCAESIADGIVGHTGSVALDIELRT